MKPETLTVVIINDFAHVEGGASQVALRSAVGLAERGHEVHLLSAVGPVADFLKESKVRITLLDQHPIAADPRRLRAATVGLWNPRAYRAMRLLLQSLEDRPVVVHAHVWVKSLSSSVIRAAIDSDVPVIVTGHDFFMACPNGGFFNYPHGEICRLRALSPACIVTNCDKRSYAQKLWRVTRQIVQRSRGRVPSEIKHVISVSDLSEAVLKPYLASGTRLHRVVNPVFVEKAPPSNPAQNEPFVVVGRLDPEKGPLLAAEAFARAGVKATFVGDGPCADEVLRTAPHSRVTGWVDRDEVMRQIRNARALVFPSLWYETMGLVVAEAAAQGVPAIVADTSSAAETTEHDRTGLLFKGGDCEALTEAVLRLRDSDLVSRLGKAAYEKYWAAPATLEGHLNGLEAVYRQALGTAPASA